MAYVLTSEGLGAAPVTATKTATSAPVMQWWGNSLDGRVVFAGTVTGQGWRNFPTQSSAQTFADYYTAKRMGMTPYEYSVWKINQKNAALIAQSAAAQGRTTTTSSVVSPAVKAVVAAVKSAVTPAVAPLIKPTVTTTVKPATPTVQVYYWWADPVSDMLRYSPTKPTTTGAWRRFDGSNAGKVQAQAWLTSLATPKIALPPPTTKPNIYPLLPTVTGVANQYWWGNLVTGEVNYGTAAATPAGAQRFTSQAAATAAVAKARGLTLPTISVLPPAATTGGSITLPNGTVVPATAVTTTNGQTITVPAGTTVPVVTSTGQVIPVDSSVVAAATPTEAGVIPDKIFGLPSWVVMVGGGLLLLSMMTKKGR